MALTLAGFFLADDTVNVRPDGHDWNDGHSEHDGHAV